MEEQNIQPIASTASVKKRSKAPLIIGLCIVLTLIFVGAALYFLVFRPGSTPASVLENFYTPLYTMNGGYADMLECVIPQERKGFSDAYASGGLDYSYLSRYRLDAIQAVGENVTARIEIVEQAENTASMLKNVKSKYPTAVDQSTVLFRLILEGDDAEIGSYGSTTLVKVGTQWYMHEYAIDLTKEYKNDK